MSGDADLAAAHLTGRLVAALEPPADIAAAYAVQDAVADRLDAGIAGWKAAVTPSGPVVAPIYGRMVSPDGAVRPRQVSCVTGVEVELAVRLRSGALQRIPYPWRPEVDAPEIVEVMIGLELIGGRLSTSGAVPFPSFLADNLGNAGYVTGAAVDRARISALASETCRVEIDDQLVFEGPAAHSDGDPLSPLGACAPSLVARAGFDDASQFVTTGSLCGVIPVAAPRKIEAAITGLGRVTCFFDRE